MSHNNRDDASIPHELDADAQREFEQLNDFLAGLSPGAAGEGSQPFSSVLASVSALEQISRWSIVFRDVARLTEVSAVRDHLLRVPQCIAVRVSHISSHEISVVLTASARLNLPDLEAMLRETLEAIASAATFEILSSSTRPAV